MGRTALVRPDGLIWLATGGFLLASISACGTKVLQEFSRHDLDMYCRARQRRKLLGEILDQYEDVTLGVENLKVFGQTLFLGAGIAWRVWVPFSQSRNPTNWIFVDFLIAGTLLLVATVWIPATLARLWSSPFLFHTWRIWKYTAWFLQPVGLGFQAVDSVLHRLAGRRREKLTEEDFEEEIRTIVTEGMRDGLLEEDAGEMIEGVIELSDVDVADIMTPRSEVDAMEVSLNWEELLQFVTETRRTRIPVYERELDNVIGILHVKDLLPKFIAHTPQGGGVVRELLRKPEFVPKSKPVDDLLQEFQVSRNHIAIVVDEYQSVEGIVTIEDVLEEIVGEIMDEHDYGLAEDAISLENGAVELSARVHVDEINEQLGLDLPEEDEFDTIGGFVSMQLGRIPQVGEQVQWKQTTVTVLEASKSRIQRIRIELPADSERETS